MGLSVVLPTYNGAPFLAAQLDSIAAQTRRPDLVMICDDGSTDDSCDVAMRFARRAPFEVTVHRSPHRGLPATMRALLAASRDGHVALADQDDVWLPDKLARAMAQLDACRLPTLYAARRIVTDADLTLRGLTRIPRARAGFAHALRRNIAPGNTLVLNPAAAALAQAAAVRGGPLPAFHDWWLYQLVTGAGGQAIFDPKPVLLYRQHGRNLFGASLGARALGLRLRHRFDGTYRGWLHAQCAALGSARSLLTPQAATQFDRFVTRHQIG